MNPLFVAWHTKEPPAWGPVGRLEYDRGIYRFCYTQGARQLVDFRLFDGMDDLAQVYESTDLFPLFQNRLLPKSRPEYRAYLTWSGLDPDKPLEPLMLLGRTGGLKETDAVELFPCPQPDSHGCYINLFFAHGVRYHLPNAGPVLAQLRNGDRLEMRRQPLNPVDPKAVAIFSDGTPVGYVPRYLAADVSRLIDDCDEGAVRLLVQQVNYEAPTQQRLLCRLHACWPDGFQPCSGEAFQPIVAGCNVA
jgi:hypothetical protein